MIYFYPASGLLYNNNRSLYGFCYNRQIFFDSFLPKSIYQVMCGCVFNAMIYISNQGRLEIMDYLALNLIKHTQLIIVRF